MGYNPFKWWSKGVGRRKKLPKSAPLLARIQNGDFEYSPYFYEAKIAQEDADKIYNQVYASRLKFSADIPAIEADARDASKMRRIARNKLMESGVQEEQKLLHQLKTELEEEFGVDLWEKAMEKQRGKGTTEDIYWWYKKQVSQTYTKSELKMRGINVKN
jgi:hypothetical protein